MIDITVEQYRTEVTEAPGFVLVDFWAAWCAPCKAMKPVLEDLAFEYEGRVKFVGLDVDAASNMTETDHVRSLPTLTLFKDGQIVTSMVGAKPAAVVREWIEKAINE